MVYIYNVNNCYSFWFTSMCNSVYKSHPHTEIVIKTYSKATIISCFSKSWFQILHLMDFQRKFKLLSWRTLFICCLVLTVRDFFLNSTCISQATNNALNIPSCISRYSILTMFLARTKIWRTFNLYRFYFFIQNTFFRFFFLNFYFHISSFDISLYSWHVQNSICTFVNSYTEIPWNFRRKSCERKLNPTVRCNQ